MRPYLLKRTIMPANCHEHVAEKELNLSPTLKSSSKANSKGRSSYFLTARYRKQSTKIWRRKSCRASPQMPTPPMTANPKGFWRILRRLAGARKSSSPPRDRSPKDIQINKKDVLDCEPDDRLGEKNKNSCRGSEYCKERKDDWDAQSEDNGARKNLPKARELPAPKLSCVEISNFRIRLYYQLNVVKRTKEKPSDVNSLKLERLELGSYCPLTRLKGKHYLGFERSKPIEMETRRISKVDFESRCSNLRKRKMSQSDKGFDNEDVFTLDIEPILRSWDLNIRKLQQNYRTKDPFMYPKQDMDPGCISGTQPWLRRQKKPKFSIEILQGSVRNP